MNNNIFDIFSSEGSTTIKLSTLYDLMRRSAKLEIAMNCIKNGVPNEWSRQVFDIDEDVEEQTKSENQ